LIDKRWHSGILDTRSFRGADCENGRYLVGAKVREILVVSKQEALNVDEERFNLRKINELQIEITNRCSAFENLSDDEEINRT
jgi:hypothetical protein